MAAFSFSMNIHQLFNTLVERKQIALCLSSKSAANTLRISLLRKFNDYRDQMQSFGFLPADLEGLVVSMEWNEDSSVASYFLRKRKKVMATYELLDSGAASAALGDSDAAPV